MNLEARAEVARSLSHATSLVTALKLLNFCINYWRTERNTG